MISYRNTRSRRKAITLALVLGAFGIQRFYVGRNWTGLLCCYFCGLGIPALIGFVDALRWARMSDAEFAARYGFLQAVPRRNTSHLGALVISMLDTAWHLLRAVFMMSPLLWPMIVVTVDGELDEALIAMVAAIGTIAATQTIGRRIGSGVLRHWLDPLGSEKAARVVAHKPISRSWVSSGALRRGPMQHDQWAFNAPLHEGLHRIESPAVNPATGLYMSGPGTAGIDAAGNFYGQSHWNDYSSGWSSNHWD